MEQSLSESYEKAIRLYSEIRVALFKKNVKIKEIAEMIDVSPPSVTRTIQSKQYNRKVVEWVKENLNIIIVPIAPKVRISPDAVKKGLRGFDPRYKKFFTPKETEFYYGISTKYLAQQRYYKIGISYRKLGRKVLYAKEDVENYFEKRTIKIKVSKNV